jgi:hypothetical protein
VPVHVVRGGWDAGAFEVTPVPWIDEQARDGASKTKRDGLHEPGMIETGKKTM